jgi:hypothetical protein
MANGKCYLHGGATPAGVASPHYKDGRRSRYLKNLPCHMGAAFRSALADPDLTCLRSELCLQAAMIEDRLVQLSREEGPAWSTLVLALDILQLARSKGEPVDAAIDQLDGLIRSGAACARARHELWSEVRALMVEKTRTAAAEAKRLADLQGLVRVEDALLFARALLAAARETVTDRDQLRRLQERALALLPPDEYDTGPVCTPTPCTPVPGDGTGVGNGHAGPAPAAANGHPPEPAPEPAQPSFPGPVGGPTVPDPPPPAPAPPATGPVCGLKELPEGADPADWEWVDEGDGAAL